MVSTIGIDGKPFMLAISPERLKLGLTARSARRADVASGVPFRVGGAANLACVCRVPGSTRCGVAAAVQTPPAHARSARVHGDHRRGNRMAWGHERCSVRVLLDGGRGRSLNHCGAAVRAGRYEMLEVLAASIHGRTYRARGPDGPVALKELVFALVPTVQQLEAFEREARVLASLSHPNVPRFFESFREGQGAALRLYLAQELVVGEPLSTRLADSPFNEPEARDLADQGLCTLGYLHGRGIVHRDVKPANLVRRPDGSVALVDYGAARTVQDVTHGATLVGTYGYMPAEQLGGPSTRAQTCIHSAPRWFTSSARCHRRIYSAPSSSSGWITCVLAAVPPVPRPAHRSAPEAHRLGAGSSPGAPGLRPARPSPESRCPGAGCLRPRDDLLRELLRRLPGGRPDQPGAHRTGSARSGALGLPGG